jgi:hypothetical protein
MDQAQQTGTPGGRWSGTALPIRETSQRYAAAAFTADLEALQALMPSERLHPVQIWRGRGLLLLEATEATWSAADEPLFDLRSILVGTAVSVGAAPAKPWEPMGDIFEEAGSPWAKAGFLTLQLLVSNEDAADFFSEAVGYHDVRLADIDAGTTAQADWFVAAVDGVSAIGLAVRNTGRSGEGSGGATLISLPGGEPHASFSRVSGTAFRASVGKKAASLKVGPDAAGDIIRQLQPGRCLGGTTAEGHQAVLEDWPAPIIESEAT